MNYHGMPPENHLKFMFNAEVEATGRVRQRMDSLRYPTTMPSNLNEAVYQHIETEREIAITMGEKDYDNFMRSYGKYLELVYETERDPIARDMLEKLSMYLILKR